MLKKGLQNLRSNVHELMTGKIGASRKKAIATYAKKHGISHDEARQKLAVIIAKAQL